MIRSTECAWNGFLYFWLFAESCGSKMGSNCWYTLQNKGNLNIPESCNTAEVPRHETADKTASGRHLPIRRFYAES